MIGWIRRKLGGPFTRWYVKRGYTFDYEFEPGSVHILLPKPVWTCPWWVKPLLIFFSPSVYAMNKYTNICWAGTTFKGNLEDRKDAN